MGMRRETLVASTTETGSDVSGTLNLGQDLFVAAIIELDVTASTAPTTLDVFVQVQLPDKTNWTDIVAFTQVGAVSTARRVAHIVAGGNVEDAANDAALTAGTIQNGPIGGKWRVKWTLVGTNYTFSVTADLYN